MLKEYFTTGNHVDVSVRDFDAFPPSYRNDTDI